MNKYWIAGLFIGSVLAGFVTGCQYKGSIDEKARLEEQAKAQAEVIQKTKELNDQHEEVRAKYEAEQKQADATIKDLKRRIADGSMRLSIRTTAPVSGDSTVGNREARADIDGRDAAALIDIAGRGDEAIRKLNQCVDQYDAVRSSVR